MLIGLYNIYGFFPLNQIDELGIELETAHILSLDEFKTYIGKEDVQIVDLRGKSEFEAGHVEGADHVFVGTLENNLDKISKDKQIVIHCQAGEIGRASCRERV